MTESTSDLLEVLFLFKICKVSKPLAIVPLFETPDSLKQAEKIMAKIYEMAIYRKTLRGEQQIMLGYSDSAKRAGRLASSWEVYQLQKKLSRLGQHHALQTVFFHGRGGSVARGGGPVETALLALPRPHTSNKIRIPEQGESIQDKLGLQDLAMRTFELYLAGFLEATLSHPKKYNKSWLEIMKNLATFSSESFRKVVYENPYFLNHYQQITPIRELGLLKIGSRPGKRKPGKKFDFESLRAIPWVFSWTQNRCLLPAWLGLGESLEREIRKGHIKNLKQMYRHWNFFKATLDMIEMSLAVADEKIVGYYSELLVENHLAFLTKQELSSLRKTRKALLKITSERKVSTTYLMLLRSIKVRTPYVDVLNILQAHLIKEYRGQRPNPTLRKSIAITLAGISAGMRNTG